MEVNQLFVKAPRSCCYKMLRLLLLTLFFLQIHGNPISMDFKASKPLLIQWLIIEGLTNWYFSEQAQDLLGIYNAGNGVDFAERIEGDAYAFEKWPY